MTEQQAQEIIKLLQDIRFCVARGIAHMPHPMTDKIVSCESYILERANDEADV